MWNIRKEENAIGMKHNKLIVARRYVLKRKKERKQKFVNIPLIKKKFTAAESYSNKQMVSSWTKHKP